MSKPEGAKCYIPRLEMTMREIPDKYHQVLWDLTGSGKSPKAVQASVAYIEGEGTQQDCADAFGVTDVAVRRTTERIIDEGVVTLEYVQENSVLSGERRFGEYTNGDRTWRPKE